MQTANFYSARDASRSFWNCEGYGCVYKKKIYYCTENLVSFIKLFSIREIILNWF